MTLLYYDPIVLTHNTGRHPECAERILPAVRHLHFVALDERCRRPSWEPVSIERLRRVHGERYIQSVQGFARLGGGWIETDTVLSPQSYDVARVAAGGVCDAVERVLRHEDKRAFCLIRPPGHHALAESAMGFCLFNNVAVAARTATAELGVERVLIVDWDVHHGNGTQDAFWEDPQVGFLSIHRFPFYPGTGDRDETGAGEGLGATLNLPIKYGTPRADYLSLFTSRLEEFAARIQPQLVLVSAGFDAHHADPIGSLGLESEDFAALTRVVLDIADTYADGRLVSVLEGGYNPDAMTECVECHLAELVARGEAGGASGKG